MRRADHPLAPMFVLEAPDERTVKRLATLCGMRIEQFRRCFDIRYIFDEKPGKGWDARRAQLAGERLRLTFQPGKKVVGVGRAGAAVGCGDAWNTVTHPPSGALMFYLASPSLSTFWDDLTMRETAAGYLKHFLELK